jgi:translation initiation factor IF-2
MSAPAQPSTAPAGPGLPPRPARGQATSAPPLSTPPTRPALSGAAAPWPDPRPDPSLPASAHDLEAAAAAAQQRPARPASAPGPRPSPRVAGPPRAQSPLDFLRAPTASDAVALLTILAASTEPCSGADTQSSDGDERPAGEGQGAAGGGSGSGGSGPACPPPCASPLTAWHEQLQSAEASQAAAGSAGSPGALQGEGHGSAAERAARGAAERAALLAEALSRNAAALRVGGLGGPAGREQAAGLCRWPQPSQRRTLLAEL